MVNEPENTTYDATTREDVVLSYESTNYSDVSILQGLFSETTSIIIKEYYFPCEDIWSKDERKSFLLLRSCIDAFHMLQRHHIHDLHKLMDEIENHLDIRMTAHSYSGDDTTPVLEVHSMNKVESELFSLRIVKKKQEKNW